MTTSQSTRILLIGALIGSLFLVWPADAHGWQTTYKVGDQIRFDYHLEKRVGTVTEITGTGWYRVEYESKYGVRWTIVPPNRVLGPVKPESVAAPDSQLRTWHDQSGEHSMSGRFVNLVDDTVTLEKEDGSRIQIRLDQLADEDSELVRSLASAMDNRDDATVDENNPFRPVESAAAEPAEPDFELTEMDFSGLRQYDVAGGKGWNVAPLPAAESAAKIRWQKFALSGSHCKGVLSDPRNPDRAWLGVLDLRPQMVSGVVIDAATGTTIGPVVIPKSGTRVLAYDAVGNRLLCDTRARKKRATIDVWRIEPDGSVVHELGFVPVPAERSVVPIIRGGGFLDENRIVLGSVGKAGVFNLETGEAEFGIKFDPGSTAQVSSDGRYLFVSSDKQLAAFDLQTRKTVGRCGLDPGNARPWAMNAARTRAVRLENRKLEIWDPAEDKIVDVVYSPLTWGSRIEWVDDENVLITAARTSSLVNLRLGAAIWRYGHVNLDPVAGSGGFWFSGGRKSNGYGAGQMTLPHPAAQTVIDGLDPEELVVLRPGQSVRLELQAGRREISQQLEDHGFRISNDSPYVLRSSINKGPTQTETYQHLTGGGNETVRLTSARFELALYHGDEKLWFVSGGGSNDPGNFVLLDAGQTVQSVANQNTPSPAKFFASVQIPDVFVRMPEKGFYGFSQGSASGLQDR